jgi:hypothetical protein
LINPVQLGIQVPGGIPVIEPVQPPRPQFGNPGGPKGKPGVGGIVALIIVTSSPISKVLAEPSSMIEPIQATEKGIPVETGKPESGSEVAVVSVLPAAAIVFVDAEKNESWFGDATCNDGGVLLLLGSRNVKTCSVCMAGVLKLLT